MNPMNPVLAKEAGLHSFIYTSPAQPPPKGRVPMELHVAKAVHPPSLVQWHVANAFPYTKSVLQQQEVTPRNLLLTDKRSSNKKYVDYLFRFHATHFTTHVGSNTFVRLNF